MTRETGAEKLSAFDELPPTSVSDLAAGVARTPFFFSSDTTLAAWSAKMYGDTCRR